jgi:MSHA pilin protein MshD
MFNKQRGATLIELVVAIVIISIAITGVIVGTSRITRGSADPMIYSQAQAIAEAYLEEILLKEFSCGGGPEGGETRATYNDVDDYHTPAYAAVADQEGNAVPELAAYQVSIEVACTALNGIPSADAATVAVAVGHTAFAGDVAVLTGFRTRL